MKEEIDHNDVKMLRKKAELLLSEKLKAGAPKLTEFETDKLLHELQVHQIELEMQNEELRQAYQSSEAALRKYTLLFDLAPIGFFSLDSEGEIADLNFTGADILNEKRYSLLNSNIKLFVAEESRLVFNDFFKRVYATNSKETCMVKLRNNSNELRQVYLEGVVTEDAQNCLVSVVDLSKFATQGT